MFMTKLAKLKDILIMNKFLFNDSLHGVLNRPFFRSKKNVCLLVFFLISLYVGYFYLNMIELAKLDNESSSLAEINLLYAKKITLSSYYNVISIFAGYIFLLVTLTFNLSKNSLFFVKTLPFEKETVSFSIRVFKLITGLGIFELIFIVIAPTLKLIVLSPVMSLTALLSFHIVFIVVFELLSYLYDIIQLFSSKIIRVTQPTFIVLLLGILSIHMVKTRFIVDNWVAMQNFQLNIIIVVNSLILTVVLISLLFLHSKIDHHNSENINIRFIKVVKLSHALFKIMPVWFSVITITRVKSFWYFISAITLMLSVTVYSSGMGSSLELLMFILPLLGLSWIYYADATIDVRKMFRLYRIGAITEIFGIITAVMLLAMPLFFIGLIVEKNLDPYLYMISISIIGLISGFLFPKSKGNINETMSAMLALILIVLLTLIINVPHTAIPTTVSLIGILYYVIKKETRIMI